jgi:hypothetical protein
MEMGGEPPDSGCLSAQVPSRYRCGTGIVHGGVQQHLDRYLLWKSSSWIRSRCMPSKCRCARSTMLVSCATMSSSSQRTMTLAVRLIACCNSVLVTTISVKDKLSCGSNH